MDKSLKKFALWILVLTLILSIAACAPEEEENPTPPQEQTETPENGTDTETPSEEEEEANNDEELTQKLLAEEMISNGRIYESGDYIVATMLVESGVSQTEIEALAESYGQEIKEKYPDKKVNVQAIQDGNNVVNLTLD